jgi:membrane protease YdiL (CAAX protease family)
MASIGTQLDSGIASPPPAASLVPSISNFHRWIDLSLVLLVAFAGHIFTSINLAFHPGALNYSNSRLGLGVLEEAIALALFLVLFQRQGRRIQDIGFGFRWTDLPKAVGLVLAAFTAIWVMTVIVRYVYFLVMLTSIHDGPRSNFLAASIWLMIPFSIINPFFEEILVRGYLMTEFISLRKSVVLATVVSLAVQTSYHLYYGVLGAATVGVGLSVFAIYYAKSRRLMPIILAHMLWDFTTVLSKLHQT